MSTIFPSPTPTYRRALLPLLAGLPLMLAGWALLWTVTTYWNPLLFFSMWTGAILVMYALGRGYPGLKRHLVLSLISVPLWWWFEIINGRVENWVYRGSYEYGFVEYAFLASLAFSTVVPALEAAWGVAGRVVRPGLWRPSFGKRGFAAEIGLGMAAQAGAFLLPDALFPLVWVAPFLALDGLAGLAGRRSLLSDMVRGEWRLAVQVALAGLLCGILWEFWNYWALPRWEYQIPYLSGFHVFAMPLAGYAGYIPFAWSIFALVTLVAPGRGQTD